jgi:RecA/RadA recombinase
MSDEIKEDIIEEVVDVKEILDSVKLKPDESDELEGVVISNTLSKEVKISEEQKEHEDEVQSLYNEFSSFIEQKTDMTPDIGVKDTISTGIDLVDAILGGGFAIGAMSIIIGSPGSGKSMLAMQTMGQGQRQHKGKLLTAFLDSEEATTEIRLANLGVKYPKIKPHVDITVEKVFQFLEGLCVFKHEREIIDTPSILVWDSIANTLSQKEREAEDVNQVIGYKARMLSILIPKYVAKCAQYNICFLAVNQLRDVLNIGQFAPAKDLKLMTASKDMPGGNVLKFNAFQLVEMKIKSIISETGAEKSDKYGFEGIIVKLKCVKNKLFPPNIEIEMVGSFVTGFSNFWTNYNFLKNTKRLNTGAWNYLVSLPEKKFRTKDAQLLYKEDEVFKTAFDVAAKEAIQTDIIDKYNPKQDD